MVIQGREIGAQHDTGAERGNFIAHDLACKLKLQIRTGKSDCKSFSMANGKVVRAIGRAKALCAFAKEPCSRMKCWFYVFKGSRLTFDHGCSVLEDNRDDVETC